MKKKIHIKVGNKVKIIAGNEKGNIGKVLFIDKIKNRAIVEGINIVKVHKKPSSKDPQGGIHEKESSIHISNLMLVDGKNIASKVGFKDDENGKKVKYSKKTGELI